MLKRIYNSVENSLRFLKEQHSLNYSESWHIYSNPMVGMYIADIFQKAVISDVLLDAEQGGFSVGAEILANIQDIISSASDRGWRYFPNWTDLPPDADTLGMILQVVSRSKLGMLQECEKALELLVRNRNEDGSFNTWLLDNPSLQGFYNYNLGGGKDVEVIANLLYGLHLYDPERFRVLIDKGLEYVISQQRKAGDWESTWYFGNYYGMYVCLRIIKAGSVYNQSADITKKYILKNQQPNGSWDGETTYTAFAILALSLLEMNKTELSSFIRGIEFLLSTQDDGGSWRAGKFIRMSHPERKQTFIPYTSRTITAAYCLKALISAHRVLGTLN